MSHPIDPIRSTTRRASRGFAAACVVSLVATVTAGSPPSARVFELALDAPVADGSRDARITFAPAGEIGPGARIAIDLGENVKYAGVVERRTDHTVERYTIGGVLAGRPHGDFLLAVNGSTVVGVIHDPPHAAWRVGVGPDGRGRVRSIDPTLPISCAVADAPAGPERLEAVAPACDNEATIDVLVLYTEAARDEAGGTVAIEAEIDWMVADANAALANSDVDASFRLVYVRQLDGAETALALTRLSSPDDGYFDEIHALRELYAADQVAIIRAGTGGVAHGLDELTAGEADSAFSISGLASAPGGVFAHELGHNLGACHALGDGGGCGSGLLFSYSNGHRFWGNSFIEWRTMMAYSPGTKIRHYSSPAIEHDGAPTGVAVDESAGADNASTLRASVATVAAFRCRDDTCFDLALPSTGGDCDGNGLPDACELARGFATDVNGDGLPDTCGCPADASGSGEVGFEELMLLLGSWGPCVDCRMDLDADGEVGFGDLMQLMNSWGPCVD